TNRQMKYPVQRLLVKDKELRRCFLNNRDFILPKSGPIKSSFSAFSHWVLGTVRNLHKSLADHEKSSGPMCDLMLRIQLRKRKAATLQVKRRPVESESETESETEESEDCPTSGDSDEDADDEIGEEGDIDEVGEKDEASETRKRGYALASYAEAKKVKLSSSKKEAEATKRSGEPIQDTGMKRSLRISKKDADEAGSSVSLFSGFTEDARPPSSIEPRLVPIVQQKLADYFQSRTEKYKNIEDDGNSISTISAVLNLPIPKAENV
ncbi:unnamed protein product, partial [Meganyctiphanes norvegica]